MKVYERRGFANPTRVRLALAEKGLIDRVEFIEVDLLAGAHRTAAFRQKNPMAAVPVLELDDGTCIAECTAITEYLDHLDGPPTLTGRSATERGVVAMMQRRVEAGLLDAISGYFHHATPGLGPALELYQNKDWGLKSRERAVATMRYVNEVLAAHSYLAGEQFSVADITAYAAFRYADYARVSQPDGLTHVQDWRQRCAARPSMAYI